MHVEVSNKIYPVYDILLTGGLLVVANIKIMDTINYIPGNLLAVPHTFRGKQYDILLTWWLDNSSTYEDKEYGTTYLVV